MLKRSYNKCTPTFQHKVDQNKLKNNLKVLYIDHIFIFAEENSYPPVIRKVATRLSRLLKLANIDILIIVHSFRHTHTSLLIEAKANIKEIQERLGHIDISTNMNIYAHLTKSCRRKDLCSLANSPKVFYNILSLIH